MPRTVTVTMETPLMRTVLHPGDALSPRQRLLYVVILGALTALGPMTIDLYLPAFPRLQADLGASAAMIQLTLTGTTIGFALGQIVIGPLSDRVGRRLPLTLATCVHVLACVGAAIAPDVWTLGALRLLQGIGAAGGGVVALAMVRDLFGGFRLVVMLSRLSLVSGLAPILAPVIGSQLLLIMDWRGIFGVLAAFGVVVIVAVLTWVRETLPPSRRNERGRVKVMNSYRTLLGDRVFIGVAVIGGMTFSGLFAYLSSSPFLFQGTYGFSPQQFGLLFAANCLGIEGGVQLSARLTRWWDPQWTLAFSTILMVTSASLIVMCDRLGLGLWGTIAPLWLFIFACGLTFPCVQVLGLNAHGHVAGTAASLLGAANFGFAGMISPMVGVFGVASPTPMAVTMGAVSLVGVLSLWLVVRPKTVPSLSR